jgi:hypothetical protein
MALDFGLGSDAARASSAILFMQASMTMMDTFSALNSSPWTAESFGSDPQKQKSCREYVYHGLAVAAFYSVIAAALARNIWPIIGAGIGGVYMFWLYMRALNRAQERGSTSWDSTTPAPAQPNTPAWGTMLG